MLDEYNTTCVHRLNIAAVLVFSCDSPVFLGFSLLLHTLAFVAIPCISLPAISSSRALTGPCVSVALLRSATIRITGALGTFAALMMGEFQVPNSNKVAISFCALVNNNPSVEIIGFGRYTFSRVPAVQIVTQPNLYWWIEEVSGLVVISFVRSPSATEPPWWFS